MTQRLRNPDAFSPFDRWINRQPLLSSDRQGPAINVMDVDKVIHQFIIREDKPPHRELAAQNMMFLEIKTHGKRPDDSQLDTLKTIASMMLSDVTCPHCGKHTERNGKVVQTRMRGQRTIRFHGIHVVTMSGDCPDSSEHIWWSGNRTRRIDVTQLVDLLRFKLDAYTLRKREERSHHKRDHEPRLIECGAAPAELASNG